MQNILKLAFLSLLISLLFITIGCDETNSSEGDITQVDVTFRAMYNEAPLEINERYDLDGRTIMIEKLSFYLADLSLKDGIKEFSISEIDFIDFTTTNTSQEGAAAGVQISKNTVPLGDFDGLSLSIGVPSDLNESVPSDFSSSHPLGRTSEHWSQWDSYIFSKIEGKYDTDGDPTQLEESFIFHVGTDPMFRIQEFTDMDITTKEGSSTSVELDIDVKELFRSGTGYIDLTVENAIHSNPDNPEGFALASKISDNWKNSLILR